MPLKTRLFTKPSLILLELSDVVTREDILDGIKREYARPAYRPDTPELADARGASQIDISFVGMMRLAHDATRLQTTYDTAPKLAILIQEDVVFGMARMFQSLIESTGSRMRVELVFTEQEALGFLGFSDTGLTPLLERAEEALQTDPVSD